MCLEDVSAALDNRWSEVQEIVNPFLNNEKRVEIWVLVKVLAGWDRAMGFYNQLLSGIAKRLGKLLSQQSSGGPQPHADCVLSYPSGREIRDGVRAEPRLPQYVASCKVAAQGLREFSFATDKGTMHTLQLQVTVFGTPDNNAWLGVPQVGLQ